MAIDRTITTCNCLLEWDTTTGKPVSGKDNSPSVSKWYVFRDLGMERDGKYRVGFRRLVTCPCCHDELRVDIKWITIDLDDD